MSVTYVQGNALEPQGYTQPYVIAHGCNLAGVMGAGIAAQVKDKFPWAYESYLHDLDIYGKDTWRLGEVDFAHEDRDEIIIANCYTQADPGPNAKYFAVATALANVRLFCLTNVVRSVHMPQIGCGIGGLDWNVVKVLVEDVFEDSPVECVVYEYRS